MRLTQEQAEARAQDTKRDRAQKVKEVRAFADDYDILLEGGTGFILSKERLGDVAPPEPSDPLTLYTVGWSTIRGVDLRGEPLYYRTDAELEADHAKWVAEKNERDKAEFEEQREELDAKFAALPEAFQRRIRWFRDHNPDFRWKFEAYEMTSCVDAVRIFEALQTKEAIKEFGAMSFEEQRAAVPGISEAHSGNSFGMAVRLAWNYAHHPLLVVAEHGAMTPLTGCEEYGCAHPRDDEVVAAVEGLAEASA